MLVVFPAAEALMIVWPLRLGGAPWRYGAAGLLSRTFLTPLLGLTIILVTAVWFRDRLASRALAVVGGLASVFLLLVTAAFVFDASTLRGLAAEQTGGPVPFNGSAAVATIKLALGGLAFAVVARSGWLGGSAKDAPGD